jgi:uncharacterized membrane protein YraQ (UPF0718 family)/YHS domain-containing protein
LVQAESVLGGGGAVAVLAAIGDGLLEALSMFWDTLWALILGFALSGVVQAFVPRGRMQRVLGDHRPRTMAKAGFLGFVSSSCSYAAAALAKSLFARGADFTASMVFMFASTNLVVELGIVMWLLLGWQFALAEFVGGAIMIALLGLVLPRVMPRPSLDRARAALGVAGAAPVDDEPHEDAQRPATERITDMAGWSAAAGYTISDLTMLRKELVIGFGVAGFATVLVPTWVWQSLFLTGGGFGATVENVLLGPLLAILAFVCSIGNVPLAAALWSGGISFGGVIAFVFADLITLPLLMIYRRYYGTRLTLRLLAVFWAVMSVAGLAVEGLFSLVGWVPTVRPPMVVMEGIGWDYTTVLNIIALLGFAGFYVLYRMRGRRDEGRYAKDPICGMQVEKALAPATARRAGQTYYFCSDHCQHHFAADEAHAPEPERARPLTGSAHRPRSK